MVLLPSALVPIRRRADEQVVPPFRTAAARAGRLLTAALAGVAGAAAVTTPAVAAAPALDGISARPVDAAGRPTGEAYVTEHRDPGSSFERRLAITNGGTRYARVWVYPVDATTGSRGGTVFAHRDAPDRGAGSWLSTSKELLRLKPGERKFVSVQVHVPQDARPGDHVGGIAIEPLHRETTGSQFSVTHVLRVVVGAHIRVRGDEGWSLVPEVLRLERVSGSGVPALFVGLANDGERLCRPVLTAAVFQGSRLVSSERRELETLLPGTTIEYPVYWPRGLGAGRYTAQVHTEHCGHARTVRGAVELSDAAAGSLPAGDRADDAPADDGLGAFVWLAIAGGALGATGFFLRARARRRLRRTAPRRGPMPRPTGS